MDNGPEVEVDSFGRIVIREQRADDGTRSLINSLTHALTYLLTYSLTYSLTHALTYSLIRD